MIPGAFGQATVSGVTMPAVLEIEGHALVLNGAGLRERLWIDLYVGGLYLPERTGSAEEIIDADREMAIRLHVVSGMVTSRRMAQATREGFDKALDDDTGPLEAKITAFIEIFEREPIAENDVFNHVYVPSDGVKVYKNGSYQSSVEGLDFKQALFGIWLSDDPVDKKLKRGMLGG